jgi:ribonuclease-3
LAPEASDHDAAVAALIERLAYNFSDPALLECALTHRSWCSEHAGVVSNERLEFLGDAVLGLVVAHHVYENYPELAEGRLTDLRKAAVSEIALAEEALDMGVGAALMLGKGESSGGGRRKSSLLADALEAIIGAIYLDGGWPAADAFVSTLVTARLASAAPLLGQHDAKTRLQEFAAHRYSNPPLYSVTSEGPDHAREFTAEVELGGSLVGRGVGASKKRAQQAAAAAALMALLAQDNGA